MDVAFEKHSWTIEHGQAQAGTARAHADCSEADQSPPDWPHPDWHVLRARMRAVREAWQVMREAQGAVRRCGSFDRGSAWQLTALRTDSGVVNQIASVNGNRRQDTHHEVAGMSNTGARGLK